MDLTRFGALVRTLEERARRRSRLYRVQVALLAALGYGYVVGVLLALLALIGGLGYLATRPGGAVVAGKLLIPALVVVWVLVRALWIRVPDLEGLPLTAERVPALFAAIERVRAGLDAPRFRRVLLTGEFNAAIAQRPRFGVIGPWVSDLMLGLPLLHALAPEEFDAVLAHEMGHVSRQHGRFGHWIYRVRGTWSQLGAVVEATPGGLLRVVLGRFLGWYAPFFNAYTFVLARQDEYEADQAAVRIAGRSAAAAALLRIPVVGRFYGEQHWGRVSRQLRDGVDMTTPHAAFVPALATELEHASTDRWLNEELRRPTDLGDTHPALANRFRAIGAPTSASVPPPPARSAAAALLGSACDALAGELDARWWAQAAPQVAAARAERDAAARRLATLEATAATDVDAAWERVPLLEGLDRLPEARAAAEALLGEHPDHAPALFFLGRVRLAADEPEGIPLLERAAALHPPAAPGAQALIFDYLWRQGRRDEAERARAALSDAATRTEQAEQERRSLASRPVMVPHGLPRAAIQRLRSALASVPGLRAAYLVRRVVVEMPEVPCYLVGLVPDTRWWKFRRGSESERLIERVDAAVEWPPSTYFVVGEGAQTRLVRRMRKVPGAVLVGRGKRGVPSEAALTPGELEALHAKLARRTQRRRRVVRWLLAGAAVFGLWVWAGFRRYNREVATTPLREFTVAELAERVRQARGHVLVLVLYEPFENDAALVDGLRRWAAPLGRERIEVLAVMTGGRTKAQEFVRFAPEEGRPRLPPLWLTPWRSGVLDSTMATVGVRVGQRWTAPLVAVIDPTGHVRGQGQGVRDVGLVIAAARRALAADTVAVAGTRSP